MGKIVPNTADVAVIGAGAIGLCCAISLAERGARVALIERALPGAANSTLTGGGIRQQFGTMPNIAMSLRSAPFWDRFTDRFGVDPLFRDVGYLFLGKTEAEVELLATQVALQRECGIDSELLDASELTRRWPALAGRDFQTGAFRQRDGWANQQRIIDGLYRGALALGVSIHVGTECLSLVDTQNRITGVQTTTGQFSADAVVLATGPWVRGLLDPFGLSVPVAGHRHELLIVEPAEPIPDGLPWLIGVGAQVHMRPDAPGRVLLGGFLGHDEAVDPDNYATGVDSSWAQRAIATAATLFGIVDSRSVIRHGWAGLYPATPDRLPIIDRLASGLYSALGFSGTGLMHAPAAGELIAELVLDGEMNHDCATWFSAARFSAAARKAERTGF